MGIGVSIILIAAGAILTWAVNASVSGLELQTIGVILMVVGAIGLLMSMIFWSSWGGFHRRAAYVEGEAPVRRRTLAPRRSTTVIEEDEVVRPGPGPPLP